MKREIAYVQTNCVQCADHPASNVTVDHKCKNEFAIATGSDDITATRLTDRHNLVPDAWLARANFRRALADRLR